MLLKNNWIHTYIYISTHTRYCLTSYSLVGPKSNSIFGIQFGQKKLIVKRKITPQLQLVRITAESSIYPPLDPPPPSPLLLRVRTMSIHFPLLLFFSLSLISSLSADPQLTPAPAAVLSPDQAVNSSPPPAPAPAASAFPLSGPPVPALFVLGDSSVDSGTNNFLGTFARADHPPYGRDFDTHSPTGRFSNGRIPVDYLGEFRLQRSVRRKYHFLDSVILVMEVWRSHYENKPRNAFLSYCLAITLVRFLFSPMRTLLIGPLLLWIPALKLGLPFVPSYLGQIGLVEAMIRGVNFASAASGIIFSSGSELVELFTF